MTSLLAAALLVASPVSFADGPGVEPPVPVQEHLPIRERMAVRSDAGSDLAVVPGGATGDVQGSPQESPAAEPGREEDNAAAQVRTTTVVEQPDKDFMGIKFGVGVAFTLDWGGQSRVKDAELVNNIVRVTESQDGEARVLLEVHHFWPLGTGDSEKALYGVGPFVSVQPGSDDVIDSLGIGVMVGMRRNAKSNSSLNIGLGLIVDPNSQLLGDGIVANQPLPAGETAIRYKTEYETGFMLMASFSF